MGYRTQRRFKQEQRAFADWQCQKDREQDESFGEDELPSEAELEDQNSDDHYARLDAARRYALPIRGVVLGDEMGVGR